MPRSPRLSKSLRGNELGLAVLDRFAYSRLRILWGSAPAGNRLVSKVADHSMDDALTPIEVEVLRLISQGCTYSLRQRGTPSMGR